MSAAAPRLGGGLYLVLTEPAAGYERMTEWAVAAGLPAVQFRPRDMNDRAALRTARAMRALTRGSRTLFIVNDRVDLALACDADGAHIGQDDLPPDEARRLLGPRRLLGWSTHALDQVRAAADTPVDYLGFGPVFTTTSKTRPDPVAGPAALAQAVRLARQPVVAIGGLTWPRIRRLPRATTRHVAAIRALSEAADPARAMKTWQAWLMEEHA
jgi:thiamine-phosphate pyrophosphorylase